MKRLVFFLLLISCLSLTRKQNAILSKIDFVEGDNDKSILYEAFDQVRKKLFAKLTSSHIWEADTLILFESWNIQSGEHWGTLWSRGVSYNYQYR